jgi:hypothetical protein
MSARVIVGRLVNFAKRLNRCLDCGVKLLRGRHGFILTRLFWAAHSGKKAHSFVFGTRAKQSLRNVSPWALVVLNLASS